MMRATLTWAAAALMMAASAVTAGAQTPTEINFGVISTEASMNQKKNWEPFLQAMSKATGLKVNGFYATDYAGVIEAMRFNKIHLAWYGNKSGMEAVDRANGEVFAHIVARDGSVGYYSHVIVHKDSPFTKIDDILKCDKSLDFGIGDPNSTSGFLVPTSYIFAARNHRAQNLLQDGAQRQPPGQRHGGRQQAGGRRDQQQRGPAARGGVGAGRAQPDQDHLDLAADPARSAGVAQGSRPRRQDQALHIPAELRPHRLGSEIKTAKGVLADLIWAPFHPSSDSQLIPIRVLEANKNLMKAQADEKLSADEKARQVAAIRAEIEKLEEMQKKAAVRPFQQRVAAFLEADKAGNQDELKKMIAEFAAGTSSTH